MNSFGYVRVSTLEQNEDRQLIALREQGVPEYNIFIDKQSGKDFKRPQYSKMLSMLRAGDILYVMSIDRLGRDYEQILNQWRKLTKEIGVNICIIDMPLLDTRKGNDLMGTFIADLVLQILSFVAQSERESIHQRQRQGIEAAKRRGVRFGRPEIRVSKDFNVLVTAWENGDCNLKEICREMEISEATFYRRLRKYRNDKKM